MKAIAKSEQPLHGRADLMDPAVYSTAERNDCLKSRRAIIVRIKRGSHSSEAGARTRRPEGNGDVVADILVVHRQKRSHDYTYSRGGSNELNDVVYKIYGVTDLVTGGVYPRRMDTKRYSSVFLNFSQGMLKVVRPLDALIIDFHAWLYGNHIDETRLLDGTSYKQALERFELRHEQIQLDDGNGHDTRTTLCQNADMIAILNARGTVLLNSAYTGLDEQIDILKLATLALDLYHNRVLGMDRSLGA